MTKYEKYIDDDNVYHYELTLENGSKHWVKKELGDYLHSLEQQVKNLSLSSVSNRYLFYYEDEGEKGYTFEIEAKHPDEAFDKAYASYGSQVENMMYKQL